MNVLPRYPITKVDDFTYSFISKGRLDSDDILKHVEFKAIERENFYYLNFGDYDAELDCIDDQVVSNNNDALVVFATVITAIHLFTNVNRNAYIFSFGNSLSRNRLYRIGVNKYLKEITTFYDLYCDDGEGWVEIDDVKSIEGFLVKRLPDSFEE